MSKLKNRRALIAIGVALLIVAALSLFWYYSAGAQSVTQLVALMRGESVRVTCDGANRLRSSRVNDLIIDLSCGQPLPPPTATSLPATATPEPPPATATPVEPTATATTVAGTLPPVDLASMLGNCPASVHDAFVTTGPDGNTYRTWHPQTVTLPDGSTCTFAHEHGDDPRTSAADNSLPPFGYIGAQAGLVEPHEGFKIYVVHRGERNDEGRTAQVDSRIVVHMTTGRPLPGNTGARFTMPFHSLEYDMIAPDGHEIHVQGMANTFAAGSICERDARSQSNNPVGRVLYIDPRENTCAANSTYEIWGLKLDLSNNGQQGATIHVAAAAFDTQTGISPSTGAAFATGLLGCDREAYHGPVYWYNRFGPTTFRTDAYGAIAANGPLEQYVSNHNDIGILFSNDQGQFKKRPASYCNAALAVPN